MNARVNSRHPDRRDGQAMVEFIAALVCFVALFAALMQILLLSQAQTDTMTEARRRAGRLAILPVLAPSDPDYIRDWSEGDDGSRYSKDDVSTAGNQSDFIRVDIDPITPTGFEEALLGQVPNSAIGDLEQTGQPIRHFGLVHGRDAETIPLLPAVRHLLYNADHIEIESDVWLSSTHDIY